MRRVLRIISAIVVAGALGSLGLPIWQARHSTTPPKSSELVATAATPSPLVLPATPAAPRPPPARIVARLSACLEPSLLPKGHLKTGKGGRENFVAAVEDRVEIVRGLQFAEEIVPEFVSLDELHHRLLRQSVTPDVREQLKLDLKIMSTLGIIRSGKRISLKRLVQGVAGFYDPRDQELLVGTSASSLGLIDDYVLAHEFEHALADQAFGLPDEENGVGLEDSTVALTSLFEGDATLTASMYYVSTWGDPVRTASIYEAQRLARAVAARRPAIQRILAFPYLQGTLFVCDLFARGGWQAVNDAYLDPPTTTAQVLFPNRYGNNEGEVPPRPLGSLGGSWRLERTQQLGAFDLLILFSAPGGFRDNPLLAPLRKAAAWAGGELQMWVRGSDVAIAIALTERDGADGLCDSMTEWLQRLLPHQTEPRRRHESVAIHSLGREAVAWCRKDEVRLAIAPTLVTARRMVE